MHTLICSLVGHVFVRADEAHAKLVRSTADAIEDVDPPCERSTALRDLEVGQHHAAATLGKLHFNGKKPSRPKAIIHYGRWRQ